MKTKHFFLTFLILTLVFSCSRESLVDEDLSDDPTFNEIEQSENQSSARRNQPPNNCFITGAMVNGSTPYTGSPFTVYASSGPHRVNYNRRVTITLMDFVDNLLIAQQHVTILANQNVSNNAAITARVCNDNITAVVTEVRNMSNFTIDNSCTWRNTGSFTMNNCSGEDHGSDIDFCNGNDADGDGICDDIDPYNDTGFE